MFGFDGSLIESITIAMIVLLIPVLELRVMFKLTSFVKPAAVSKAFGPVQHGIYFNNLGGLLTGWQGPHCQKSRIACAIAPFLARPQAHHELCS